MRIFYARMNKTTAVELGVVCGGINDIISQKVVCIQTRWWNVQSSQGGTAANHGPIWQCEVSVHHTGGQAGI